jgi:hypothetical protein
VLKFEEQLKIRFRSREGFCFASFGSLQSLNLLEKL